MNKTFKYLPLLSLVLTSSVAALEAPKIPATAKKLSGSEISALYEGSTIAFNNFTMDKSLTGTVAVNIKGGTQSGSYMIGGAEKGEFKGTNRIRGDRFCYVNGKEKEKCMSVYLDGANIYEVDAKGVVTSMNHKQ